MDFFLALAVLILDAWAIVEILGTPGRAVSRLLWVFLVVLAPGLGFLIWLLRGPRRSATC